MQIEYEATFPNVNKDKMRQRLRKINAVLIKPEFLQKRVVFNLPKGHKVKGGWLRVRNEGDKITMSFKIVNGVKIEDQKEICLRVDDFNQAVLFLEKIGCQKKAYQENKRELWRLNDVEITIDEWPFLEPFIEIEANQENKVKTVATKLGLNWNDAFFGSVDTLYSKKYGIATDIINNQTPKIVFEQKNPFMKN